MTPNTYADSPVVIADNNAFSGGSPAGAALPEARVGDGYLSDLLGDGFPLVIFARHLERELDIPRDLGHCR